MTQTLPGADIRGYYAALGIQLPPRAQTEASVRCFANPDAHRRGDHDPSCSVNLTHGAWHCHGCGASGGPYDAATYQGHSSRSAIDLMICHGLTQRRHGTPRRRERSPIRDATGKTSGSALDVSEGDIARWHTDLSLQPLILQRLARQRAWSMSTVRAFELGIDGNRITIPVRNERRQLVGLLRYRPWDSRRGGPKMLAAPGSRRQLLPHPSTEPARQLLLVEGEPDMLAARSHGLPAIALPGVESWKPDWAASFENRRVDIVMDADRAGRATADQIARDLALIAEARIIEIAPRRADGYDLTDWLVEQYRANTPPYEAILANRRPPKGGHHETYV